MLMSVASNGGRCGKPWKGRAGIRAGPFFEKKNLGSFKKSARCGEGYGDGKRAFFEGDTFLNCCFSILMFIFGGVCITT